MSRWVLENAEKHQLSITWGDAGPIMKWIDEESGDHLTIGKLNRRGYLSDTDWFIGACKRMGVPLDVWIAYSDEMIRLVPGAYRKKTKKNEMLAMKLKKVGVPDDIPLAMLWPCKEQWFAAIDRVIKCFQDGMRDKPSV